MFNISIQNIEKDWNRQRETRTFLLVAGQSQSISPVASSVQKIILYICVKKDDSREEAFQLPYCFHWEKVSRIHETAVNILTLLQMFLWAQVILKATASVVHTQHAYDLQTN